METGTLVVGRIKGSEGLFVLLLVDVRAGCVLESPPRLSEAEVRKMLADKYGESESQIKTRLELARRHPEI
jgi:hypothetical protein